MKKQSREYILFIEDILLSMERIQEYIEGLNFIAFMDDSKTVDAVIRNFEIIGEASKNIPKRIKEKYEDVPWEEMYRLRNKVNHEYFGIDYETIWEIATNNIPHNYLQLKEILEKEQ